MCLATYTLGYLQDSYRHLGSADSSFPHQHDGTFPGQNPWFFPGTTSKPPL
jgi:hypothetical protein